MAPLKNIHILSNEFVRPSSPTINDHLKKYKLSMIDHLTPHFFVPLIFYYNNRKHQLGDLKQSLSYALTMFYPLAGRLKRDDNLLHCNDSGVRYLEAKVDSNIMDFIEDDFQEAKLLDPLIPLTTGSRQDGDDQDLLRIQINYFNCGGIAIGVCISHRIADAFSFVSFMKSWAALSTDGSNTTVRPSFVSSSLFPPPNEKLIRENPHRDEVLEERLVSRRFVFHARLIEYLREKTRIDGDQPCTSRVEAVSAFIWKYAACDKLDVKRHIACHSVNLRTRMVPRVPEHSFGNLIGLAFGESYYEQDSNNLAAMARRIRESIRRVDEGYMRWIREEDTYATIMKSAEKIGQEIAGKEVELFNFSSWCRFPVYDVDFGMGKPDWVSLASLNKKNCAILMDSKCGNGIEAWITMNEEELTRFQINFIEFANAL